MDKFSGGPPRECRFFGPPFLHRPCSLPVWTDVGRVVGRGWVRLWSRDLYRDLGPRVGSWPPPLQRRGTLGTSLPSPTRTVSSYGPVRRCRWEGSPSRNLCRTHNFSTKFFFFFFIRRVRLPPSPTPPGHGHESRRDGRSGHERRTGVRLRPTLRTTGFCRNGKRHGRACHH